MAAIVTATVVVPTPPLAPITDSVRGLASFDRPACGAIALPVRSRSSLTCSAVKGAGMNFPATASAMI